MEFMLGNKFLLRSLLVILGLVALSGNPAVKAMTLRTGIGQEILAPAPIVNEHGIVGINIDVFDNRLPRIHEVYPNTPAYGHLQRGDTILAVDETATGGLSKDELDDAISDTPGRIVYFLIQRHGNVVQVPVRVMAISQLHRQPVAQLYQSVLGAP